MVPIKDVQDQVHALEDVACGRLMATKNIRETNATCAVLVSSTCCHVWSCLISLLGFKMSATWLRHPGQLRQLRWLGHHLGVERPWPWYRHALNGSKWCGQVGMSIHVDPANVGVWCTFVNIMAAPVNPWRSLVMEAVKSTESHRQGRKCVYWRMDLMSRYVKTGGNLARKIHQLSSRQGIHKLLKWSMFQRQLFLNYKKCPAVSIHVQHPMQKSNSSHHHLGKFETRWTGALKWAQPRLPQKQSGQFLALGGFFIPNSF